MLYVQKSQQICLIFFEHHHHTHRRRFEFIFLATNQKKCVPADITDYWIIFNKYMAERKAEEGSEGGDFSTIQRIWNNIVAILDFPF